MPAEQDAITESYEARIRELEAKVEDVQHLKRLADAALEAVGGRVEQLEAELLAARERLEIKQGKINRLQNDLLAAQEREKAAKEEGGRWFVQASEQQLRAHKAEEREKALREALEALNHYLLPDMEPEDAAKVRAALALAGSPSEKPSKDAEGAKP